MLIFNAGIAVGFCIKPAQRAYANYDWFRNFRKYGFKQSIAQSFDDIWS